MNSKTHKSAIVLSPPASALEPIQEIRRVHDRNVARWMPHVTLVYPFFPQSQFNEVVESLSEACKSIAPFNVRLREFKYFQHGRKGFTIWLSPEPRAAFEEIQATVWSVVPDCDEVRNHKNGFTPHLSVGQVRDQAGLRRIREELQSNWRTLEFEASEVCLISREDPPDDVFRVNYRVELGSNGIITE